MKRKGDLLSTVLGVVLMALGIAVFIFGITKLYSAHVDQESENAKSLLEKVVEKVDALSSGQSTQATLQGFSGGESWYFVGWSLNDPLRPQKCFFSTCLCVCPGSSPSACQGDGFCRTLSLDSISLRSSSQEVIGTFSAGTGAVSPQYGTVNRSCVVLRSNLFEITLSKNSSSLKIEGTDSPTYMASNGWTASRASSCNLLS